MSRSVAWYSGAQLAVGGRRKPVIKRGSDTPLDKIRRISRVWRYGCDHLGTSES